TELVDPGYPGSRNRRVGLIVANPGTQRDEGIARRHQAAIPQLQMRPGGSDSIRILVPLVCKDKPSALDVHRLEDGTGSLERGNVVPQPEPDIDFRFTPIAVEDQVALLHAPRLAERQPDEVVVWADRVHLR